MAGIYSNINLPVLLMARTYRATDLSGNPAASPTRKLLPNSVKIAAIDLLILALSRQGWGAFCSGTGDVCDVRYKVHASDTIYFS